MSDNPKFGSLTMKHMKSTAGWSLQRVARMQRSGIREWRGSELSGLRNAPSGLRFFFAPSQARETVKVFNIIN